jgi:hypothetical protein
MIGRISGVSSQHEGNENGSYQYMSANRFRGAAEQRVDLSPLEFYLEGHLKTLVYCALIEK